MNKEKQTQINDALDAFIRRQVLKGDYGRCYLCAHGAVYRVYDSDVPELNWLCHVAFDWMNVSDSAIREAIQRVTIRRFTPDMWEE